MKWKIEKGTIADLDTISRFQIDMALESEGMILDSETILQGVKSGLSDSAKGIYFLAKTENGETAGSLFLTKEWSDWNNGWYWWIQSVFIRQEYRRMGAFSFLYGKIREFAREEGAVSLRLYVDRNNRNAQNCYGKLGMEKCHYLMLEESLSSL